MAILFVAAEADELKPFAQQLTALRKLKWPLSYAYEGIWEGRRFMLAANGAGPSLASQAVEVAIRAVAAADLSASKLQAVISVGYCGALQPGIAEGTILLPLEVLDQVTQERYLCAELEGSGLQQSGTLISQDRVATTAVEKRALGQHGAIGVDMESSGVAARAKRAGLLFSCIKVVTDREDESFGLDWNKLRSTEGRIARGKIVNYVLRHPALIPEVYRLKRRTEDAAKALGEFLVSCRIHFEGDAVLAG